MSDDITFCGNECNNTKCHRHRSNIKEPQYPHSVALLEGTEYCEKKHKPTSVRLIDAEALRNEVDTWGCNDYDKYDFLDAIDNAPTVDLRLMKVEECEGHTLDYAMGWKACIEWLKQGGDTQYFDKENKE